jgi:hypothetical protein
MARWALSLVRIAAAGREGRGLAFTQGRALADLDQGARLSAKV